MKGRSVGCTGPILAILCSALLGALVGMTVTKGAPVSHAVSSSACPPPSPTPTPSLAEIVVHPPVSEEVVARTADELVRASVGRWVGTDGTIVEVDPPKPLAGKAPPYKLIVRGAWLPKSGFGCEFANGEIRHGPGDMTYFKSWCSTKTRSTLGLGLDTSERVTTLSLVIITDGDVKVHADRLKKETP